MQGLILCACNLLQALATVLGHLSSRKPQSVHSPAATCIDMMSPGGCMQDDATVKELTAKDTSRDMKGWLQHLHTHCFHIDLSGPIASSDVLLRIHATAEEFEATAEEAFVPFQASHVAPAAFMRSGGTPCTSLPNLVFCTFITYSASVYFGLQHWQRFGYPWCCQSRQRGSQ